MAKSTVNFTKGATNVTVNGPGGPTRIRSLPRHVSGRTADLTRVTYKTTATKKDEWELPLTNLNDSQKTNLQNFYDDTTDGPALTFTYTHSDGTLYTAQFVDTEFSWMRNSNGNWDLTIRLEISQRIST